VRVAVAQTRAWTAKSSPRPHLRSTLPASAPDLGTRLGRRAHTHLIVGVTGLRVSETSSLTHGEVILGIETEGGQTEHRFKLSSADAEVKSGRYSS
jgi:hypothetical protein